MPPRPAPTRATTTAPSRTTAKKTQQAAPPPPPTRKQLAADINAASQSLSALVKAGWKARTPTNATVAETSTTVSQCRANLAALRSLAPQDLDVERSAVAVLGKVVALELFEPALNLATDIRPALAALYHPLEPVQQPPPPPAAPAKSARKPPAKPPPPAYTAALASLPLPSPHYEPPDAVLATTIAHYLVHALVAASHVLDANALASHVSSRGTLLDWHPLLLAHLQATQLNQFMRAPFQHVPKHLATSTASPGVLFRIRTWTLECLLKLSGDLDYEGFWNQAIIFASMYAKGVTNDVETADACRAISTTFSTLVRVVQNRPDATSFVGVKSFAGFSQRWMQYAKKISDLDTLNHISRLMDMTSLSASTSASSGGAEKIVAKICVAALQASELMERFPASLQDPSLPDHLHRVSALLASWIRSFSQHGTTPPADEQLSRVAKVLGKLRRACVDCADMWATTTDLRVCVLGALGSVVECVEMVQSRWAKLSDMTNGVVDALVVMARAALREGQSGIQPAYAHLERAIRISKSQYQLRRLGDENTKQTGADIELAQRLRVVAAALYVHGGGLYKDALYGHAALYLKTSCDVACEAIDLASSSSDQSTWKDLKEQLSKRYELHGVCCFKFGDRKIAFQSYCDALRARSFAQVARMAPNSPPQTIFTSPDITELAGLLERTTWLAAGELFMPGTELSARRLALNVEDDVAGALVEWQMASLEQSNTKDHIREVLLQLSEDALQCYDSAKRPVRRSRVILKRFEQLYSDPSSAGHQAWHELYAEAKRLLVLDDLQDDKGLIAYRAQYLATAHIWAGLLAHRDAGAEIKVLQHLQEAATALQDMLGLRKPEARRMSNGNENKPVATRATRNGKTPAAKAKAPVKKPAAKSKKIDLPPVTPRPARRGTTALLASGSSPVASSSKVVLTPVRDDWKRLFGLLRMAAQLLGLLGHTFVRIRFLKLMRHLSAEVSLSSDEFVRSSLDLASEYAALGLVDRTLEVLGRARIALFGEDDEETVGGNLPPSPLGVELLLLTSRMLAEMNEPELSIIEYRRAAKMCDALEDERIPTTALRIRNRALQLERSALACSVFASIELSRDNPYSAVGALTQALRLWNRAVDSLARLNQPPPPKPKPKPQHQKRDSNPFDMSDLREALGEITNGPPTTSAALAPALPDNPAPSTKKAVPRTGVFEGLQWRMVSGVLSTLFCLARLYFLRGSARESQFFINQALELARSTGAPAMQARALARKAELALYMRDMTTVAAALSEAETLFQSVRGVDIADLHRLHGLRFVAEQDEQEGSAMLARASAALQDIGREFASTELEISSPKRVKGTATQTKVDVKTTLTPALLASILRNQIWLLRNSGGDYQRFLDQFTALVQSFDIKGEHTSLLAKLAVHTAEVQLGSDLFLSSLADSTIAIPMRVTCDLSASTRDILKSFVTAETLLLSTLEMTFERGHVCQVREAAISLASVSALQASLGRKAETAGHVAAGLLNLASAITLERELLDSIQVKTNNATPDDDLLWPTFTARGTPTRKITKPKKVKKRYAYSDDEGDEDEEEDLSADARTLTSYWGAVRERHRPLFSQAWQPKEDVDELPSDWTIVSISVTEDKRAMFVSRQRPKAEPLVFCVPLERHNRHGDDDDDEERFTYHDAMQEFASIIRESNEGTARAQTVKDMDRDAKAEWWSDRAALDKRMQQLLDNIEYCWLGAFKTVLNDPLPLSNEAVDALRARLEAVFARNVASKVKDKRQISKLSLNASLVECFLTLDPTCRDEELEDLVYFMLDLYQFNGVSVAAHDIDVDTVVVDLRVVLEECKAKVKSAQRQDVDDDRRRHLFLVLDKNVQGVPWESIPVLRGRAVSRIPTIAFLMDRLQLSRTLTASTPSQKVRRPVVTDRALVNPAKTTYILNPSGDLKSTEQAFAPWLKEMDKEVGWDGIIGRAPAELEMVNALTKRDLVIYFGHGSAEQYVRSHKIRNLPRCAATMLWGCSSGALRDMGEFDRTGTPDSYMLGGCPTLVANLWDVTDKDIDRLAQSVFTQLRLNPDRAQAWKSEEMDGKEVSVVAAVAKARNACKLKYLTGAATVVYGIPFYC
ncbi:hypothetical protein EXIGLDRAFT_771939 [Exidia glandulosa HHB12029]|uniref:separase n=1 Tax=Exidia glandulosa HHB12029 TaxID=1314781 RepID=A0A165FMB2_EXIGL|nr:hypothetical protein EXIGLDRAFT_771939 [Exidia glandulosa HHB12029]